MGSQLNFLNIRFINQRKLDRSQKERRNQKKRVLTLTDYTWFPDSAVSSCIFLAPQVTENN